MKGDDVRGDKGQVNQPVPTLDLNISQQAMWEHMQTLFQKNQNLIRAMEVMTTAQALTLLDEPN